MFDKFNEVYQSIISESNADPSKKYVIGLKLNVDMIETKIARKGTRKGSEQIFDEEIKTEQEISADAMTIEEWKKFPKSRVKTIMKKLIEAAIAKKYDEKDMKFIHMIEAWKFTDKYYGIVENWKGKKYNSDLIDCATDMFVESLEENNGPFEDASNLHNNCPINNWDDWEEIESGMSEYDGTVTPLVSLIEA